MYSKTETFTRDQVAEILTAHNTANRPKSPARVRRYVREMNEGRWVSSNPHGISFDVHGMLQNGQHTLEAFLASTLETLEVYVHYDVPAEAMAVYDQALPRSAAQILAMETGVNSSKLTSAARAVLEHGLGVRDPSNQQVVAWALEHREVLERYLPVHRGYTAGTHAAFVFADLQGWKHLDDAAERLVSLVGNGDQDPMLALARALRDIGGRDGASAKRMRFHTTLTALKAVHEDKGLERVRRTETMPPKVRESVRPELAA